jgi:hypothetical protein
MDTQVDRQVHTSAARAIVEGLYQARLHTPTWARWRAWARIPKRTVWLSIDQLQFLIAIAWIRRSQRLAGLVPIELQVFDVLIVAYSEEVRDALDNAFREIDNNGLVLGRELSEALKTHGVLAPTQMLYRKIKDFSTSKYYPIADVVSAFKLEYAVGSKHANG